MDHITMTPFGARPVTAGDLARLRAFDGELARRVAAPEPGGGPDKWALLRDLAEARAAFGVTDRDIAVLAALLGFHPDRVLDPDAPGGLVVFPSNAVLGARAHGMAESTLRRHLAALVTAGLIRRRDSPNGKRYAARDLDGGLARAFGLDLAPLALRAGEVAAAARAAREAALRLRRLRETASLWLRDAEKLAACGAEAASGEADWAALTGRAAACRRALRRRLDATALEAVVSDLTALRAEINAALVPKSEKMSGGAVESGRHYQNSKPDESRIEPVAEATEKAAKDRSGYEPRYGNKVVDGTDGKGCHPPPPLDLVLRACPEVALYARSELRCWRDLIVAAEFVRPMLGVSLDAWGAARTAMGSETAATVVACLLERADRIRSPGGYLRALTTKARSSGFSALPMVLALLAASRSAS